MRTPILCLVAALAAGAAGNDSIVARRDSLARQPMLFNLTDRVIPQVVTGGAFTSVHTLSTQ
ncbi:MAG: hypothetical protein HY822_18900 [Acidobacteria bacterium]|nr:hypothetical protein [Acidobacteriota bacterium]